MQPKPSWNSLVSVGMRFCSILSTSRTRTDRGHQCGPAAPLSSPAPALAGNSSWDNLGCCWCLYSFMNTTETGAGADGQRGKRAIQSWLFQAGCTAPGQDELAGPRSSKTLNNHPHSNYLGFIIPFVLVAWEVSFGLWLQTQLCSKADS